MKKLVDFKCQNCKLTFKSKQQEGLMCPRCYKSNFQIINKK